MNQNLYQKSFKNIREGRPDKIHTAVVLSENTKHPKWHIGNIYGWGSSNHFSVDVTNKEIAEAVDKQDFDLFFNLIQDERKNILEIYPTVILANKGCLFKDMESEPNALEYLSKQYFKELFKRLKITWLTENYYFRVIVNKEHKELIRLNNYKYRIYKS